MLADELDYVIGVDTHRDQHVLAVVAAPTGALLAQPTVRTDARGYREAMRFADRHAPGARAWAVEGAGHYGAAATSADEIPPRAAALATISSSMCRKPSRSATRWPTSSPPEPDEREMQMTLHGKRTTLDRGPSAVNGFVRLTHDEARAALAAITERVTSERPRPCVAS